VTGSERCGFEHLLRELAPQVLGAVVRRFRDFAASEDAVQEALLAATQQWPHEGVPANPRGWLIQVALRRMTDHVRGEIARRNRENAALDDTPLVVAPAVYSEPDIDPDDTLVLLFMCCHPALSTPSAVALTLRAIGGLTTAEIAHAFLVPESTLAQRISRAKQSIHSSQIPFALPDAHERLQRLGTVLQVLYLIFNEGYASSSGAQLQRTDLSSEAIRLTRALQLLRPDEDEITALLALMLLTDARRGARTGPAGELVPLDEQDRSLWQRDLIVEGLALIGRAFGRTAIGEYQLQAAIAAVHDQADSVATTNWPQIVALYTALARLADNPMVILNRAVAVAMVEGPAVGLELIATLDQDVRLRGHYRLDAVRGHLFERLGQRERAIAHYVAAANATTSAPERDYLRLKAARLNQKNAFRT
jgi:RNA polymerase sigma factor (sigma-70 family)